MNVIEQAVSIPTSDGAANGYAAYPEGAGRWPGVLLYMDAIGVRPELRAAAKRLAASGYFVLLPNLFYRSGPCENFDVIKDQKVFMGLMKGLDIATAMRDTKAYLAFLDTRAEADPVKRAAMGYCMGGRMALAAAGHFGKQFGAVAAIHAGAVATDAPDSPHLLAAQMRAKLYIAVAGIDPFLKPGETERLKAALDAAHADYTLEVYPDVQHGFAVAGLPVYNESASERQWQRVTQLFREAL